MASGLLSAQPTGFRSTDSTLIRKKFNRISQKIITVQAAFSQEKSLSFMDEKVYSQGLLYFKKPDMLRLEYTSPYHYLLIMNGHEMIINSDDNQIKLELESNKLFLEINNLIVNAVNGNIFGMPEMRAKIFENDQWYFITMVPANAEMKKYISRIELYLDKKTLTADRFKVVEESGDYTLITFDKKKINETISDQLFSVQ
jgi:outer membrane lipoprotein-sorting protein